MNVDLEYLKSLLRDKSNFGEEMTISYKTRSKDQLMIDTIDIRMNRKTIYSVVTSTLSEYWDKDNVLDGMIKRIIKDLFIKGLYKSKEMIKEHEKNKRDDR